MSEKLNLSGKGKASNAEIENVANDIFNELRVFDSPKDAGSTLTLAHYKLIVAAFPPPFKKEAFAAIDSHCDLIKQFLNENWQ